MKEIIMKRGANLIVLLLLLTSGYLSFGQSFISAVSEFQPSNDCKMELVDGTLIEGKVHSLTEMNGNITALTLKDAAGVKHKYKAVSIKRFQVKMGFLAKMDAAAEGSSSISEMTKTDFNEIVNREYIIYQQALLPKKKDKYRLLQLVNPGFDSKIQVFNNPKAKETGGLGVGGVKITGGKEKSYLVVVDNKKSIEVEKGSYKKDFIELYSDCDKFIKTIDTKKPSFWDMAAHVFAYDQLCINE